MAFSLCLEYEGERYYIHRSFAHNPGSPKTTNNQNFAMLFSSESLAIKFRKQYSIPDDYEPTFIVMRLSREISEKSSKSKAISVGSIDDSLPDFLMDDD